MASKKRLIDADVAIERAHNSDEIVGSSIWETSEVVEFLEDCPTVDAVEVVRCKDCAYAMPDGFICFGNGEMMPPHPTYPDRHCSCGERRTEE